MTEPVTGLASQKPGYLVRHWRGELGLGVSFWINGTALSFFVYAVAYNIFDNIRPKESEIYRIIAFSASVIFIVYVINVWQLVGIWRSADRHRVRGGGRFRAAIAQGFVVVFGVDMILSLGMMAPALRDVRRVTTFGDLSAPARIESAQDGSTISLVGLIHLGTAEQLERRLSGAPDVRTLRLHSPGGYTADAWKMRMLVRQRGLDTYVEGECSSACAIVFLAGRYRLLRMGGRIGFHRPRVTEAGADAERLLAEERRRLELTVLPAWFVVRIFETPHETLWYPSIDELRLANVITTVVPARDHPPNQEPAAP